MKLDKSVVQRRVDLMAAEGVVSNLVCPYRRPFRSMQPRRPSSPTLTSARTSIRTSFALRMMQLCFPLVLHGLVTSRFLTARRMVSISQWSICRFVSPLLISLSRESHLGTDEHEIPSRLGAAGRQLHQRKGQGCHCYWRW